MERFTITKQIGIDAGHRVPYHGSKCRSVHGHRYEIFAKCEGPLVVEHANEEEGMVMDFGFLAQEMKDIFDTECDHALIIWVKDPLLQLLIGTDRSNVISTVATHGYMNVPANAPYSPAGKLYIMPSVPTAENLAKHWYDRLAQRVRTRSGGRATLCSIRVHETPSCVAEYSPKRH